MKPPAPHAPAAHRRPFWRGPLFLLVVLLAACGGGGYGSGGGGAGSMGGYSAPTITMQPASVMVAAGQTASFSVVAAGYGPLSYQWMKNSVDIPGATASRYTTPAVTSADDNAQFAVRVSNAYGGITSNHAILTVT